MSSCHVKVSGIEFGLEEIKEAVENKRLLSMELELSLRCNFRCPYCYVPDKEVLENELSLDEIFSAITQANELGSQKIILLGGEPMLYPYLFEVIEHIRSMNMDVEMFTNGFGITEGIAEKLLAYGVNVVLKMNTFDENIQDELSGHKGAYTIIHDAFRNLQAAGYPSRNSFMAVSTIICRQNIDELRDLWKWLRDKNIEPYFEIITPQGDATNNDWLSVEPREVELLFKDIEEIDKEKYGYTWEAQPPLVGNKCLRHSFSCLLTSQGDVSPCVGVPFSVGNIRSRSLKQIIEESEVIQNLRDYRNNIKGPCKKCEKAELCYGCRGAAYNLTGDYLASDPICWKNTDKLDEIDTLPVSVDGFVPHEGRMRIVDAIVSIEERKVETLAKITQESIFVDEEGVLDPTAHVELIAQSLAAMQGFNARDNESEKLGGFLLGVKNLEVFGEVRVGDELRISAFKEAKFGDFGIIKGTVFKDNETIASGEIKVYTAGV